MKSKPQLFPPAPDPPRHSEYSWQLIEYGRERQRFDEELARSNGLNHMGWGAGAAFLLHFFFELLGMEKALAFLVSIPCGLLLTLLLNQISRLNVPTLLANRDQAIELLRAELFANGLLYEFMELEERELDLALNGIRSQGQIPIAPRRELDRPAILRRFETFAFNELQSRGILRQAALFELSERQLISALRLAIHSELAAAEGRGSDNG